MALANSMIKIGSKVGKGLAKGANAVQKVDDIGVDLIKTKLAREARNAEYLAKSKYDAADILLTAGEVKDLHRAVGRPEDAQAFINMLDEEGALVDESFSQFVKRKISNESYFAKEAIKNKSGKIRTVRDKAKSIKNIKNNGTADANLTDIANLTTDEINKASSKYKGNVIEEAVDEVSDEVSKKGKKTVSNIGKNALVGSAVGGISGAGIGGIAGLATGADEDDTKSMIFMGALSGVAGGAIVGGGSKMLRNKAISGSMFSQESVVETAGEIATGKANHIIRNGAKGLFNKIGSTTRSVADKIDNVGSNVSNKIINKSITNEFGYGLDEVRDVIRNDLVDDAINKASRKANTIGGAAQGAIMGSVTGATIGGVAGGIDEDETFIGGALKGGLIGGTIGGIGGGASGYFNNSAKVLSNTTANVNSLLGR